MAAKEKTRTPRQRRRRRALLIAAGVLAGVAILLIVGLRIFLHGPALADLVERQLNKRIRGQVAIGSIEWSIADLPKVVTGGYMEVTIHDLVVHPPHDDGLSANTDKVILQAPKATAKLDVHPAMLGRHDLTLEDIEIHNGYALIEQVEEPYPTHEYDTTNISLATTFYPKEQAAFRLGVGASSSPIFNLKNYSVDNVDLTFDFGDTFYAEVKGAKGEGLLRFDGADPMARSLYYSLAPTAKSARVVLPKSNIAFELTDIEVQRLAQLPTNWPRSTVPDGFVYKATAKTSEGAIIEIDGAIEQTWLDLFGGQHDLVVQVDKAGKLAERLSKGAVGGEELSARLQVTGPSMGPRIQLDLAGVRIPLPLEARPDVPPPVLQLESATAVFDMATDSGYLTDTVATGADGEVHLAAAVNLSPLSFDLSVDIEKPLDLGPYMDPKQRRTLGGAQLSGRLHAFGNADVQRLDQLDLTFGEARVTGEAFRTKDGHIHANNLVVALGGTRVERIHGVIDTKAKVFDNVRFRVVSRDTRRWLVRSGAPPLVGNVTGTGQVSGPLSDPRASAQLTLGGMPVVGKVNTSLRYQDRRLTVDRADARALGGSLSGSGALIFDGRTRLADVQAQGSGIDLSRLGGGSDLVSGTVSLTASASGPVGAPSAVVRGSVRDLVLAGEDFEDTQVVAESHADGRRSIDFELTRKAGGVLGAHAVLGRRGGLDGALSVRDVPLHSLTALSGSGGPPIGGQVEAELQLSGTMASPTADGEIQLSHAWFQNTFLGAATLEVERVAPGKMRVTGSLFQGRVEVDGYLSTRAPYYSDLTVILRRAELDLLLPDLAERHGARGWLSGEIRWRGALSLDPNREPEISAVLTEAVVLLDREDASGRPAPIRLANKTPLALEFDGKTLTMLEEARFLGPAGEFTLGGSASMDKLGFVFKGQVAIDMLAPYFKQSFDDMKGALDLQVKVGGTLESPRVTGVAEVRSLALKPAGQDAVVRVPGGRIELQHDQVSITGLSMLVDDEFSDETSELNVAGGIKLADFKPARWAININGELSGKMLLVLAPSVFSAASGSAELGISLGGRGTTPDIDGSIHFDPEGPLTLTPRGLRRELAFTAGTVLFTDQLIELEQVAGWIDDEGELADISGEISLDNWQPVDIDVQVTAYELPFRVPQTLSVAANVRDLRVVGDFDSGLEVSGVVEIVDGRYIRNFRPLQEALRPERSTETSESVFETLPILGTARLDLLVETRAFFVKNNVADIEMNGEVVVTGTPRDPRMSGVIRVEQGSFKFQGIRARFEHTRGTVNFSPYRSFPNQTPTLDLRSESDYRDISGQVHNILLTLRGPLGQLDWDLTTQGGLNRAQTLTLIFAGRDPDETRKVLGDEGIGASPGESQSGATTTSSQGGSLVVADQLLKQLAGEYFSLLMEDSVRNLTSFDVFRLEVGTQSIGVHVEKEFFPSVRGVGDIERSLNGWSWDVHGQYRLNDTWSVEGGGQGKNFDDVAEEDEKEGRVRLIWRKVFLP